ncbi:MAG: hypothetical protein A4E55_02156 [Pelotomaculum sp. PtaU1.Bin035]|nr:MAG: hypothetical protein A4E55_02156 [Pelotomaculum sp. PtaU1.Bin035]
MSRLKSVLAYTAAVLALLIALATFTGMDSFGRKLVSVTGIKVSPWMIGGEVVSVIEHEGYQTVIHRPVFDGLFSERKKGMLQIDWTPQQGLPARVDELIDFDRDGKDDFHIVLNPESNKAGLEAINPRVVSIEGCYTLKDGRAARLSLYHD